VKLGRKISGLVLVLAALDSGALTIGRVRGAAMVGQPLDVSIAVQLEADENPASLCVEADVFHADTKQDPARVRATVEPAQQAQTAHVRIISNSYVDEPVVTIYLKAGCNQTMTRRYVLLADFPSESAAPSAPIVLPQLNSGSPAAASSAVGVSWAAAATTAPPSGQTRSQATPLLSPNSTPNAQSASANTVPDSSVAPKVAKAPKAPKAPPAPKVAKPPKAEKLPPAPVAAKAASAAAAPPADKPADSATAGQSRLKLDPLMVLSDQVAMLESTPLAPVPDPAKDAARIQSLEDSVKTLVATAAKNEASLLDMRARVLKAESENVSINWVYALGALLVGCLGAIAWLWSRGKKSADSAARSNTGDEWWSASRQIDSAHGLGAGHDENAANEAAPSHISSRLPLQALSQRADLPVAAVASQGLNDRGQLPTQVDVSMLEMSESGFDKLMRSDRPQSADQVSPAKLPAAPPQPVLPVPAVQPASTRAINSDALFDVRQKAEFFVSLGQTDQAVQILEKQISDDGQTSPLIYLDLLRIFHSLNMKTDYRQFREDFNLLFNAKVPEFAAFKDEGKDLEGYAPALKHITALWNTPKVLFVIEGAIFRDPLDDASKPFDLSAFRDLLLLHAIAQSTADQGAPVSDLAPLHAGGPFPKPPDVLATAPGFVQISGGAVAAPVDLDLDLSDLVSAVDPTDIAGLEPFELPRQTTGHPRLDDDLISFDLPEVPAKEPVKTPVPMPIPNPRR
jgi:pilus assembly protein FimV